MSDERRACTWGGPGLLFPHIWMGVQALFYFISLCQKDADLLARVQSRSESVIQSWEGHMCEKRLAGEEETRSGVTQGTSKLQGSARRDEESFPGAHGSSGGKRETQPA